jgi:hypothetical protein
MFTGPNIVTDGLVLHLDAGNTKSYPGSGTTWFDKSGNENNGTLVNGTTFGSGGIVFDGVNDCTTGTVVYGDSYTINIWFNPGINIVSTEFGNTLIASSPGVNGYPIWVLIKYGNIKVFSYSLTTSNFITSNYVGVTSGQWCNITISSIKNSESILYVNGVIDTIFIAGNADSQNVYTLGDLRQGRYLNFTGTISNTQIYNRVLTPQEVLQNYNATKSRFNL